ncbi:VOC family protein [Anatilimnocola floriformis]|uniref:VOC family protein n=1 Tax=Anatilimnocola floriformis TaxID=2948575 RepID=UPI0020C530A7|nr:VOC family protein [Anatilimnocola floriformis]
MSKPATKRVPEGSHTVTPHIVVNGAAEAIEFYKKAFGAVEQMRLPAPDGKLMHACVKIGDSNVMMVDENLQWGCKGPKVLGGTPVTLHLMVEDADKMFNQAVAAGCTVMMPIADMFWGDRYGIVTDPYGHSWSIAHHQFDYTPAEMAENMKKMCPPA